MKKVKLKFEWLTKAFLVATLLMFCNGQTFAAQSIVQSTQNIVTDNLKKVKDSALDIVDELKAIKDEIQNMPSQFAQGGQSAANQALDKLNNIVNDIQNLNVEGLKNYNLDDVKEILNDLKKNVDGEVGSLKTHISNLEDKTSTLINNAKNCITLAYTMPVGITSNHLKFELAVDTLHYRRDQEANTGNVTLDAHAYWTLPFTACDDPITLAFSGKDIVLMGKGESRIYIEKPSNGVAASDYIPYTLQKDRIYLDIHKDTYVEIDCNGFKSMLLKGQIRFISSVLYDASVKTTNPKDSMMVADFEAYIEDLNNVIFEAGFKKPFKVKATDDVIYQAEQMVVDLSTTTNASEFQFPKGYRSPFAQGQDHLWTGFAIKTLAVDLSEQFPEFPIQKAAAYNMLIDETGVSGWFEATIKDLGKDAENKKKNSTIEAKFTDVSVALSGGKVVGGGLAGEIKCKALVTKHGDTLVLGVDGKLYSDANDHLCIDLKTEVKRDMVFDLPIIDTARLTLGQGSYFQYQHVANNSNENEEETKYDNIFTLVLNGGLDVDNKFIVVNGLKFEGLKLSSAKPHFDAGKFSCNGVDVPALHGLPFGIKSIGASSRGDKALLENKVYLSLISKESPKDEKQGASVEATFNLISKINDEGNNPGWKISGLEVQEIDVDINYSSFHLTGKVASFKENAVYGDGFMGSVQLTMDVPKINAGLTAYFGSTKYLDPKGEKYKYWYVSGNCDMPPGMVLFPPAVYLKSVSLSLYSRSKPDFDVIEFKVKEVKPDPTTKFGLRAGIGFYGAQDNLIDAKAEMGMEFSSSGGLRNIFLNGNVGILGKGEDGKFTESFMVGTVECNYDFENEIFDLDVIARTGDKIKNIVKDSASLIVHTEPEKWYCRIGTQKEPVRLVFMEKLRASTYLMFGHDIPTTLSPLDPKISAMFEVTQSTATSSDHSEEFVNGTGFAFGAALAFDVHLNAFIYADLEFLGGIDLLVVRGDFCPEAASKYRAKGQLYVYLGAAAGIKFRKKKFEIVDFEAAASLVGEVPKPVFVEGNIAFKYRILGGLVKGHAHAKYSHGSPCDPGRSDNGVIYDGSEFNDLIEDEKATDDAGNDVDLSSDDD